MSEMIERMAKAMQASKAWPSVFQAGAARELARAALEPWREPTDEVMDAGLKDYLAQERADFKKTPWNGRSMLRAMINEALK